MQISIRNILIACFTAAMALTSIPSSVFAQDTVVIHLDRDGRRDYRPRSYRPGPYRYQGPYGRNRDRLRARWGLGLTGVSRFGAYSGAGFGIDGQLGLQFNDLFAISYRPNLTLGGGDLNFDIHFWNTLFADFTFGDFFQVGIGPSVDVIGTSRDLAPGRSIGGVYFGVSMRAGFVIPFRRYGFREGLYLGAVFHTSFTPYDPLGSFGANIGWQFY